MNHYYLDHYYKIIFDDNFNLSNDCKVAGYDNNNFLSTKVDTGFDFSFKFAIKPLLTINYQSSDKIKAKKCVEEYLISLIKYDNHKLNKLKAIEQDKINKFKELESTVEKYYLELIGKNKKFYSSVSEEKKRIDLFINYISELKNTNVIIYSDPIIISSEYKKENSDKIIYIIIIFIMFGLFVSAIIILVKDYKL